MYSRSSNYTWNEVVQSHDAAHIASKYAAKDGHDNFMAADLWSERQARYVEAVVQIVARQPKPRNSQALRHPDGRQNARTQMIFRLFYYLGPREPYAFG